MYSGLQLWSICKACITVQSSRRILATSSHPCIRLTAALQPLALQWPSEFCGLHIARRSISYPPGSRKMSGHKWYSLEIEDHCVAWRLCTREYKVSRPCERLAAVGERHVNQGTRRRPSPRGKTSPEIYKQRTHGNEHLFLLCREFPVRFKRCFLVFRLRNLEERDSVDRHGGKGPLELQKGGK